MILGILLLSLGALAHIDEAKGDSFLDLFDDFNHELWNVDHGGIVCLESHHCFYANESMINIAEMADDEPKHSYLNLRLSNRCTDYDNCCFGYHNATGGVEVACTQYVGGQLSSHKDYGYGSFRFLAAAEGYTTAHRFYDMAQKGLGARYCFGLESTGIGGNYTRISFCGSTQWNDQITLVWQAGNYFDVEDFFFDHYVGRGHHIFRIDWFPTHIDFYIRGMLVGHFSGQERFIPNEPMHITVQLLPDNFMWPLANSSHVVDINLQLFRVRHIKFDEKYIAKRPDPGVKTELFVNGNSKHSTFKIVLIIGIIVLAFVGTGIVFYFTRNRKIVRNKDHYTPLNDTPLNDTE